MQHALEDYKGFQAVAWVLVFSFTLFTILLTHKLTETVKQYEKVDAPLTEQVNGSYE